MTLINQLSEIKFAKLYDAPHGIFKFTVTELYPDLAPVTYKFVVGDWRCSFVAEAGEQRGDVVYRMVFGDNPFERLEEKAEKIGCEILIYPCFAEEEVELL